MGRTLRAMVVGLGLAAACGGGHGAGPAAPAKAPVPAQAGDGATAPAATVEHPPPPPARPSVRLGTLWVMRPRDTDQVATIGVIRGTTGYGRGTIRGGYGGGMVGIGGRPRVTVRAPVATVVVGTPMVQGGLDRAIVLRIIRQRLYQPRSCYQMALRTKPHLAGTMTVHLMVNPQGRVAMVKASGLDPTVAACVERSYRYLSFPKPKSAGMVRITYPLSFNITRGGFSPIAPPPPPPPQPHATPHKPTPIPVIESPVVEHDDPEEPSGPSACFVTPRPDGIESIVPAARACYEQLLDRAPAFVGRAELELAIDEAGTVSGVKIHGGLDEAAATCLSAAGRALVLSGSAADELRGKTLVAPLSFEKEGGAQAAATTVTATDHDFRIGLRLLASEVAWGRATELTRTAWTAVHQQAHTAGGVTVMQVDDGVDAGAVVGALAAYGADAWKLRFARRLDGGEWKVVNGIGSPPIKSVCPSPKSSRVSVLVERDAIWIGTERGYQRIAKRGGEHDILGYARALRALRRRELAERSDLDIAVAMPGVPYGVFVRVLEIAIETGFHEAAVRPRNAILDPRRLQPRSP